MPTIPFFQLDAFTTRAFGGSPAAVCLMEQVEPDALLQQIAAENNLSETAFLVPSRQTGVDYDLRWFTPTVEASLCGHATLAAGAALLRHIHPQRETLRFSTRAGIFDFARAGRDSARTGEARQGERFRFDFPKLSAEPVSVPARLKRAFGPEPLDTRQQGRDYLLVFASPDEIAAIVPDQAVLRAHPPFGFICTAPGKPGAGKLTVGEPGASRSGDKTAPGAGGLAGETAELPDFVSRCFYPNHGIDEDPVTGSAHSLSAPYWAERLNKRCLYARQQSARGGDLWIEVKEDRITLSGYAVDVIRGDFTY